MPLKKDDEQLCKVSDVRLLLQCCQFSLSKQSTFDSKSITPWLLSFLKILNKNFYHIIQLRSLVGKNVFLWPLRSKDWQAFYLENQALIQIEELLDFMYLINSQYNLALKINNQTINWDGEYIPVFIFAETTLYP